MLISVGRGDGETDFVVWRERKMRWGVACLRATPLHIQIVCRANCKWCGLLFAYCTGVRLRGIRANEKGGCIAVDAAPFALPLGIRLRMG